LAVERLRGAAARERVVARERDAAARPRAALVAVRLRAVPDVTRFRAVPDIVRLREPALVVRLRVLVARFADVVRLRVPEARFAVVVRLRVPGARFAVVVRFRVVDVRRVPRVVRLAVVFFAGRVVVRVRGPVRAVRRAAVLRVLRAVDFFAVLVERLRAVRFRGGRLATICSARFICTGGSSSSRPISVSIASAASSSSSGAIGYLLPSVGSSELSSRSARVSMRACIIRLPACHSGIIAAAVSP
jgi:hypothetical protein